MIRQNLRYWLEKLGYTSAYQVQHKAGLNERTASRLWKDSQYIPRPTVMGKIYEEFGLQPNQYLYVVPGETD